MSEDADPKCCRCRQALTQGSSYCLSCGFDNGDALIRQHQLVQQADQRISRLKRVGRLFRFWRWYQILR